eukprot:3527304-Rhodomonas_salina.4
MSPWPRRVGPPGDSSGRAYGALSARPSSDSAPDNVTSISQVQEPPSHLSQQPHPHPQPSPEDTAGSPSG